MQVIHLQAEHTEIKELVHENGYITVDWLGVGKLIWSVL
jgi:cupin superfamily acireductone dioxygenase involved in methionine salvage